MVTDPHFLSPHNPLATVDQRELEDTAISLVKAPEVLRARKLVEAFWRAGVGRHISKQAWEVFDDMVDEYIFNNALATACADPNYPKIVAFVFGPPHEWFGRKVPGARTVGANPDNIYRQAPIDPAAHYELSGKFTAPFPQDIVFTVFEKVMLPNQAPVLDKNALQINSDGSFLITIGPEPADGRANYLQTLPMFRFLLVRDVLSDWNQVPSSLRLRRIEPPTAPPRTLERMAQQLAYSMVNDVPDTYYWTAINKGLELNTMTAPVNTGTLGGIEGQFTSYGRIVLQEDEVFLVTVSNSGATYRSLNLHDEWYRTLDPGRTISSFANEQAVRNPDGTITYAISIRDPGIHNWLDMAGYHEVYALHRWQGLQPGVDVSVHSQIVKHKNLRNVLNGETIWLSPTERKAQIENRLAQYRRRYVDH